MNYLYNLFSTKEDKLLKNIDNSTNYDPTCSYHDLDNKTINRTYYINDFYDYNLTNNKNYSMELIVNSNIKKFNCKYYQNIQDKTKFYLETINPYHFDTIEDEMIIKIYHNSKVIDYFTFKFTINHLVENTDIVCLYSNKHKLYFYFKKKRQYDIFFIDKLIYMKL